MTTRPDNTKNLDRTTHDALLSLDPAANVDPQAVRSPLARDTLARILATDFSGAALEPPVAAGVARRRRRRWVLAGATVVTVGALVVTPGMVGRQTAYASWSATAEAVTTAEAAQAGEDCRAAFGEPGAFMPGSDGKILAQARPLLVERRGVWTFVLLLGPGENGRGGFQAECLTKDYDDPRASSDTGGGGVGGASSYEKAPPPVPPNTVQVTDSGGGGDNTGSTHSSVGRVGSEVASVVINTIQQGPVMATIRDGYFAAWWPGPAMPPMPKEGDSQQPEPPQPTFTLTLKDGTIRANIPQKQLWAGHQ